jgi:hypothetical protein
MGSPEKSKNPWDDFEPIRSRDRGGCKLASFLVLVLFAALGTAFGAAAGYLAPMLFASRHGRFEAWSMTTEQLAAGAPLRALIGAAAGFALTVVGLYRARR